MFYSHVLMSKKGPLAKIWIAAHFERKLNRTQVLQTDIKTSAEQVKKPVNPLSLRSSGHLLVGLTRIFQKKVSYLFEDTTQAFHRLTNKSTKSAHLELNETEAAPAGNINMVLGGSDFDIPALGSVDVLSNLGLPLGEDAYIDINSGGYGYASYGPSSYVGGGGGSSVTGGRGGDSSSVGRGRRTDEIRLDGSRSYNGFVAEATEEDDFDVLGNASTRGNNAKRVRGSMGGNSMMTDDIEMLRRGDETPFVNGPLGSNGRPSLNSAGAKTGSTYDRDNDDDRSSVVSEHDDSVRRRDDGGNGSVRRGDGASSVMSGNTVSNKLKSRLSLGASGGSRNRGSVDMDAEEDLYDLHDVLGITGGAGDTSSDLLGDYSQQQQQLAGPAGGEEEQDAELSEEVALARSIGGGKAAIAAASTARLLGADVDDLLDQASAKDAARERAVAEAAKEDNKKKRDAMARLRAASAAARVEDKTITIPAETIKVWLRDTSDIVKPRLQGDAVLGHMHRTLETARSKRLNAVMAGKSSFPTAGTAGSFALSRLTGSLGINPAVWAIASRGSITSASTSDNETVSLLSTKIAMLAGSTSVAATAARHRNLLGMPFRGLGDITEDGDISYPVPVLWDLEAEMLRSNVHSGALFSPALAQMLYSHSHNRVKYAEEEGVAGENQNEDDDDEVDSILGAAGGEPKGARSKKSALASKNSSNNNNVLSSAEADDIGAYMPGLEDGAYDADVAGAGIGEDGAVQHGDDEEWNEGEFRGNDSTSGVTPDMKSAAGGSNGVAASSTARKSLLESVTSSRTLSVTKDGSLVGAGGGAGTDEDGNSMATEGIAGSSVDKEKWHAQTINVLHLLAGAMSGPLTASVTAQVSKSKKRHSGEMATAAESPASSGGLVSYAEGGRMADVSRGKGTEKDPLSFVELSSGASRRAVAATFFELLVLKSWDVIAVSQDRAYGDIRIARTERFAPALTEHQ